MFGGNPFVHKGDEWKKLRSEVAVGLTQLKVIRLSDCVLAVVIALSSIFHMTGESNVSDC